ncbi:3'-5' exonuclease [candidate division KSB1 bacterium]
MLNEIQLSKILFLDIETVPAFESYDDLDNNFRKLWDQKAMRISKEESETPDILYERAGIYAEFGKIICISAGLMKGNEFRIKSFYGDDEKSLLNDFANMLSHFKTSRDHLLCAHNGKEFDFPYISRRMLINDIRIPDILDIAGKKPWEVAHLDTMELWKFGDFKSYTSLDLLATVFNIPTPKDDIDGSQVAHVYWQEKNLDRIVTYCQKDVLTIAQLMHKYKGLPLIKAEDVVIVV